LPASASEWIASASIEADWVSAQAANLVIAIPVFASNAATTALLPPPAMFSRSSVGNQRADTTNAVPEPRRVQTPSVPEANAD
jgi:hypothetical protein